MARETKRININIPVDTLSRIDEYADNMSINRTSAILVLCNYALDNHRAMANISELLELYKGRK